MVYLSIVQPRHYGSAGPPVLQHVNLELKQGSRMLLVGANGAGKTTLLQILAGKHMIAEAQARLLGPATVSRDAPHHVRRAGVHRGQLGARRCICWVLGPVGGRLSGFANAGVDDRRHAGAAQAAGRGSGY